MANTRRERHSLSQVTSDRWLRRLVVVAVVTFVVSLATAATMLFTDGSADRNARSAADLSATADATLEPTTEPLPSPTTSEPAPSPSAAPEARQRPADLIARIQVGLTQLVRDGQIEEGPAEDLESRLEDVSDALAGGEIDEAWHKLRKAAEELREVREDEEVTRTGYRTLAAALSQLAQTLPPR